MLDWLASILDWKVHGPLGVAVSAIVYIGRQHLRKDSHQFERLDERLKALETDRVVKADMTRLEDRVDTGFAEVRKANLEILTLLASRKSE